MLFMFALKSLFFIDVLIQLPFISTTCALVQTETKQQRQNAGPPTQSCIGFNTPNRPVIFHDINANFKFLVLIKILQQPTHVIAVPYFDLTIKDDPIKEVPILKADFCSMPEIIRPQPVLNSLKSSMFPSRHCLFNIFVSPFSPLFSPNNCQMFALLSYLFSA